MNYKENARAALDFIKDLPEHLVVMRDYTTGEAHCLAGWLPHIGHFKALGVTGKPAGGCAESAPRHPDSFDMPRFLFNDELMFCAGSWHSIISGFPETTTDKEEAIERLKWVINK